MNRELGLLAMVRRKKAKYQTGKLHRAFPNLIQQNFTVDEINQKWCAYFIRLYLADGSMSCNCSILDLHYRSVVASITYKQITNDLAIRTLKKALEFSKQSKRELSRKV